MKGGKIENKTRDNIKALSRKQIISAFLGSSSKARAFWGHHT